MQRRARIKAIANLSASRRTASKNSTEISKKTSEIESDDSGTKDEEIKVPGSHTHEDLSGSSSSSKLSPSQICATPTIDEKISTQQIEQSEKDQKLSPNQQSTFLQNEAATFKTPLQIPRNESEASGSSHPVSNATKIRRLKIAPRLNASRSALKIRDTEDTQTKPDENQQEIIKSTPLVPAQDPPYDFASPTPTSDAPSFVVNHHIQHTGAPPSPFPHFPHSRIRTESLCSIKSNRDVTMANLQPRKNIRTEDQKIIDIKRESRERLSNKDLDKSQLRMFDMIYFNPQNNPMKPRSPHKNDKPKKIETTQEEPVKQTEPSAIPVPQLKIDANGDMVLDETSLVVENEQQKQNRILLASANVVYDDDLSGNYGYYKRQQRTKEWPHEETVKFYRCLNTVGTDFSLMLNLFPNRSRRDLKLKFKKEERNNPQLIDKALLKHNRFDLDELQRELDEEEEERKKEAEKNSKSEVKELVKRKILKKQEAKLKAEQRGKSNVEKSLSGGELALNIINNKLNLDVKENSELPINSSGTKRQYKKKTVLENVVKEAVHNFTPSMMDGLRSDVKPVEKLFPRKSKKAPESQKPINCNEMDPNLSTNEEHYPVKKARASQKAIIVRNNPLGTIFNCTESSPITETSLTKISVKTEQYSQPLPSFKIIECEAPPMKVEEIPSPRPSPNSLSHIEEVLLFNAEDLQAAETSTPIAAVFLDEEISNQFGNQFLSCCEELPDSIDENINETTAIEDDTEAFQTTSLSCENRDESFDGEAFLNSLDLEKLVLVEAQRKGKDVYEIHEIDPVTQEICDKPIDMPARYVDLIISVMTQQENDSE